MKRVAVILTALLITTAIIAFFFPTNASAGTENNPEITDAEGDAPDRYSGNNVDHLDILSAWFHAETETSFKVSIKIKSLTSLSPPPGTEMTWRRVRWQYDFDDTKTWNAGMTVNQDGSVYYSTYFHSGGSAQGWNSANGTYTATAPGIITITVLKANVDNPPNGTILINVHANAFQGRQQPAGGDWAGTQVDRAPDSGYGRNFELTGGVDFDGDGIPNNEDPDDDNDGYNDVVENAEGTNPLDPNSQPADNDGDFIPDSTDPDDDNDTMPDNWENTYGLDPFVNDAGEDPDSDNLTNLKEYQHNADPTNPDTDGDGLTDGKEVFTYGTDPTKPDTDGDGYNDKVDYYPLDVNKHEKEEAIAEKIGSPHILLIIVIAIIIVIGLIGAAALKHKHKKETLLMKKPTVIDEIFLMYRDGRLIKHFTRRLKPDIDEDILAGMLTAVQDFVKDSFKGEEGLLDEMKFGEMKVLIGRGKHIIIAAVIVGEEAEPLRPQVVNILKHIEWKYKNILEKWDGNLENVRPLYKHIEDLIAGKYK